MIPDFFKIAYRGIREKSKRSWLTVIGIMIGIASVVALISLSQGLNQAVEEEFEQMGSDKITISPGRLRASMGPSLGTSVLYEKDVEAVRDVRGVETAEPLLGQYVRAEYGGETKAIEVFGANPELMESFPQYEMASGRNLRDNDRYKAVVGSDVPEDVFEDLEIRSNLEVSGKNLRVVGILKSIGNPRDDRSVMVPLDTARTLFDKPKEVSFIYVDAEDGAEVEEVANRIEEELKDRRGEKDFSVQTMTQVLESVNQILGLIQGLMIGIAAISLVVGGVGIMNTMYTSVLEKTNEIGIMKAVGARNSHILLIFLIESGLFGLVGGALGELLGVGLGKLIEYGIEQSTGFTMLQISLTPELIIGALLFSFGIGTISGVLPARKAAKLEPVEALREK